MTFPSSVLADLAIMMTTAAVVVFIFYRLKQPMIIGYLIAGVIIGPYTPPFELVSQKEVLSATADLGVVLLIFGIGLKFPLSRLRTVGKVSIGVAGIEIFIMLLLSYGVAWLLHWSLMDALFLGTALASSSTAIIARVLGNMGKLHEKTTLIMLGILVVEDLIVVALLAVVTTWAGYGSTSIGVISWSLFKMLAFIAGSLAVGLYLVPKLIDRLFKECTGEVVLLIVLGMVFGMSMIAYALDFSVAIGAFLMGIIMAGASSAGRVNNLISPIKDMFAAIFFISVGALIDVTHFRVFLLPALMITVLMVIGKIIGCGLGTKLFRYDNNTSLKVGLGMGQIGEFAFIVMKAGQDLGVVSSFIFSVVGVAAVITTFLTPYLMRLSYRLDLNLAFRGRRANGFRET
ncbi:MAG: cation:proton antiporter [Dehalococcoidales bacterium]|nr:cation:proton antiporter [Dehalococcoidales bacterium]